jgi:CspA family cold shock protein
MNKAKIKGVLKTWKADKGFGFIKPDDGGKDIFIHISSLKRASRRPIRGDVIYYQIAHDNQGKLKAVNAAIEGVREFPKKSGVFIKINKRWMFCALFLVSGVVAAIAIYYTYYL